jgi:hypothetical protein
VKKGFSGAAGNMMIEFIKVFAEEYIDFGY